MCSLEIMGNHWKPGSKSQNCLPLTVASRVARGRARRLFFIKNCSALFFLFVTFFLFLFKIMSMYHFHWRVFLGSSVSVNLQPARRVLPCPTGGQSGLRLYLSVLPERPLHWHHHVDGAIHFLRSVAKQKRFRSAAAVAPFITCSRDGADAAAWAPAARAVGARVSDTGHGAVPWELAQLAATVRGW